MSETANLDLLTNIKDALQKHYQPDNRGEFYVDFSIAPEFTRLAGRLANEIKDKGVGNVDPVLVGIAKEIKKLGSRFSDATALARAFDTGLKAPNTNPFTDMTLD